MQAWPILEGNKRDYPRGASVNSVLISCICFVLGYLAFDFTYIQTLGLTMVYLKSCKLRNVNLRYYKIVSGSGGKIGRASCRERV